jgi:RND superfamily putative drug exporter
VSDFLIGRPRVVLGVWLLAVVVLGLLGRNLGDHLRPHPPLIDGSEPKLAHEITLRQFGSDESMVVALRGPAAAVNRQGRRLAAGIAAQPKTLVVSPWSPGGSVIGGLHPKPGVAGIVGRMEHRGDEGIQEGLELVEGQIAKYIRPPVNASMAGLPRFFTSYTQANEQGTKVGELIAIPVLLLVLLLVFRSPIAALIPVVAGGAVVAATDGVMRLLLGLVQIEAFALAAAGMMGLALGVDYSLLVVSRFREEREKADLPTAMQTTVRAAAWSVLPAAAGMSLAVVIAAQIVPGAFVSSAALAIVIAATLSALSALTAVPAGIVLLGGNLDRWSLPERFSVLGAPLQLSKRIARTPRAVVGIFLVLVVLAAWASTLKSGLATPQLLPPGDRGRVEEEEVRSALGPGWLAPIEVVLSGRHEPMTAPKQLRSLVSFQRELESETGIQEVAGFSGIDRVLHPLSDFETRLDKQQHGVARLSSGIARAGSGARRNSSGIRTAATGANQLGHAAESATDGAGLLVKGLRESHTGSDRLSQGLNHASEGTGKLARETSTTRHGTDRLLDAVEKARKKVTETQGSVRSTKLAMNSGNQRLAEAEVPLATAESRLADAWQALQRMTTGAADPQYAELQRDLREASEALSGKGLETKQEEEESVTVSSGRSTTNSPDAAAPSAGVASGLSRAHGEFNLGLYLAKKIGSANGEAGKNTGKLAKNARRLSQGMRSLADATAKMASGIAELSGEGQRLSPALRRLMAGTTSLAEGLGQLEANAGGLASGLGGGAKGSERLTAALNKLRTRLGASANGESLHRLHEKSPGLFHSGYFYLAGLDGSDSGRRSAATFMIDIGRGGHTARMMVIPSDPITTSRGRQELDRVRSDARDFARSTGTNAVVGGLTASQLVIDQTLRDRTTIARIAMMVVTALVLIPVMRSLTIPLIAAFLNLLTVSASLGFVSLLFNGSLLGGPGYVDSSVIPVTIMVIFGLAIDYEVFIFARMREEYVRTGSTDTAVANGIASTAPVVTGAAVIMITVFLCFSISEFVTLRDFGVSQATAVFFDAFVVRLIVVPGMMKALGPRSWWIPKWLDRLIPGKQSMPEAEAAEV